MKNLGTTVFKGLVALVAITISLLVYEGTTLAVPSWNSATCTEQFSGAEFIAVSTVKVYGSGSAKYALIGAKKTGDSKFAIYQVSMDGTGLTKVDSLSSATNSSFDVVIQGEMIYIARMPSTIIGCNWDGTTATGCSPVTTTLTPTPATLNIWGDFMYYSSNGTYWINMTVSPWTPALTGPAVSGAAYGVFVNVDYAIDSMQCVDSFGPPLDCEPDAAHLIKYNFPDWTVIGDMNLNDMPDGYHYSYVASPFVSDDGALWFVAGSASPATPHIYSCPSSTCTPTVTCPAGAQCGEVDNGCGTMLTCGATGTCETPPADFCVNPTTSRHYNVAIGTCDPLAFTCSYTYDDTTCAYGCEAGVCKDCTDPNYCTTKGFDCGNTTDNCGNAISCGGSCGNGFSCVNNKCTCNPIVICPAGYNCGTVDDGCGGVVTCGTGTCTEPDLCISNHCICQPSLTTCPAGYECGEVDNGCGVMIPCGNCDTPPGNTCVDTSTLWKYENSVGTCDPLAFTCSYTHTVTTCPFGCEAGVCKNCIPDPTYCTTKGYTCGATTDNCGNAVPSCGSCGTNYACSNNHCNPTCADNCGDGICCGIYETCGSCSDCNNTYSNIEPVFGCQFEYCGTDPATDPITIRNVSGQTCTFSMDVKHDGTLAAQITLKGASSCEQATLECLTSGCQIVCGNVTVIDNGQHIGTTPAGEDVTTGIVGTVYEVSRYTNESGEDIFEAVCTEGQIYYVFHFETGDVTVNLGPVTTECPDCEEGEVVVNLTTDVPVEPTPDNGQETSSEPVSEPVPDVVEPAPDASEPNPEVIDNDAVDNGNPDVPPTDVQIDTPDEGKPDITPDVPSDLGHDIGPEVTPDTQVPDDDKPDVPVDVDHDYGKEVTSDTTSPPDIVENETTINDPTPEGTGGGGGGCSTTNSGNFQMASVLLPLLIVLLCLILNRRRYSTGTVKSRSRPRRR